MQRFLHFLLAALLCASHPAALAASTRLFDCRSTFPANLDRGALASEFGEAGLRDAAIHVGEGLYENGTILFADHPEHRVEILWWDPVARRLPRSIRVRTHQSTWMTLDAIAPGVDLRTLERLNGRKFSIGGFHRQPGGSLRSWENGRLEGAVNAPCRLQVRLSPSADADAALVHQLRGEGDFSSSLPALQELNPRVYEMLLVYPMPGSRRAVAMP